MQVEKFYTPLKLCHHTEKLQELRKTGVLSGPVNVHIDLTGRCNYNCPYCYFRAGVRYETDGLCPKQDLDTPWLLNLLDELKVQGVKAVELVGGGEPLFHSHFNKVLEKALDLGLRVGIITNGSLLHKVPTELLERTVWVRTSFDAGSPKVYAKVHGVGEHWYFTVLQNLESIAQLKDPDISCSYMIVPENCTDIRSFGKVMQEVGIRTIRFSTAITKDYGFYISDSEKAVAEKGLQLLKEDYPDINIIDMFPLRYEYTKGEHKYPRCLYSNFVGVVTADYGLYVCCATKYMKRFRVGDLSTRSFKNLWLDDRVRFLKGLDPSRECPPCWMEGKNDVLEYCMDQRNRQVYFP